jgi:fumarate hydratase class I
MDHLGNSLLELVVETATNLSADVRRALVAALEAEAPRSASSLALHTIALNVDMAGAAVAPLCQDTGMPTFWVRLPAGVDPAAVDRAIAAAVTEATRQGKLRPNSVDPFSGRNSGTNLGPGTPIVHYEPWDGNDLVVRLILMGGGCENQSAQYALPCALPLVGLADRDLEGVRKCVLHAVHAAQGQGCSVGVVGVAVGGDRASGYELAKQQLFRSLDDVNPNPELARLEDRVLEEANRLGVGTMGFGGRVTLIGCKVGTFNRLPASYFVTVAYDCWALRRLGVVLDRDSGRIKRWLHREAARAPAIARRTSLPLTGAEKRLATPLSEGQARGLRVGDLVLLSGTLHTGRDALHLHLLGHDSPVDLRGGALYHCGPVALKQGERWTINAAGPATSSRAEPYAAELVRRFGLRALIGKGGMGPRTLAALREHGAVYLTAIGGAAQFYATKIVAVTGVDFLEFGVPEAMWHLEVEGFPAIVTMDAHGNSLHAEVEQASADAIAALAALEPVT